MHGTSTVLGRSSGAATAGVAGLGHILLTVGLVLLFITLGKRIPATRTADVTTTAPASMATSTAER
ncbi:DUF2871 family protein [Streptomyces sp. 2231.1]|uniref:DUF2871 family protein n=1 Tax=Streptomyces sp. 2231.1 TaxID=1855347 RepID=UPI000D1AD673|nr:DUF2871 family protein [Streptomyces sp. 2231.1]